MGGLSQRSFQCYSEVHPRRKEKRMDRIFTGFKFLDKHLNGNISQIGIARELGLGLGEVKLVIDLFEKWRPDEI